MTELRKAAEDLLEVVEAAIKAGDWKVDGACDLDLAIVRLRQALAQPEQEPVAWGMRRKDGVILDIKNADFEHEGYEKIYTVPLYTAPPKREWVGLTDEEVDECYYWKDRLWTTDELVRHVEAKLKEKNT